jgi:hypothetical protein
VTINTGGNATNDGTITGGSNLTVNGTLTSSTSITLASVSNLQVGGTLTMTGGTLTTQRTSSGSVGSINSGGSIVLSGTSIWSIGTASGATATVANGGTLDVGPSATVSGAGLLTVAAGATLKVGSIDGINATTTTGSVRTTATDSYSTTANYEYKGTAAQITGASLPSTVNNLTINNSGGNVTLTNASTIVSGALTLTAGDLSTGAGANVLTLAAAATCNGTTDVVSVAGATGGVSRTTVVVGTTYCFGNPQNQITINSGTAPTAFTFKLVKAAPAAKANAITRTYTITPTGGSGFAATMRLHYLDAELNGNAEALLHLWRLSGSWSDQNPNGTSTTRDTTANWAQQTGIAGFSDWTLAKNDPAVVTTTVANLAYTENATTALDSGVTVTDADSTNLVSATVSMTTNYFNGQDTLAFVNQNGITGTWTAATGVLALAGSATLANYQTALRSITYTNSSDAPSTATRTVTFVANDGTSNSTVDSRQITVTAVNDAPSGASKTVTTNEDAGYAFATSDFGFSDPTDGGANTLLAVKITTLPATGLLTLSGSAVTLGQYVSAANITSGLLVFTPAANTNGAANASYTFQVQDNGGTANGGADLDPTPRTITVNVTAVNDAPVNSVPGPQVVARNASLVFSSGNGNLVSISDIDAGASAVQEQLIVTNGTLTLSGVAGLAFSVGDGTADVTMTFTGTMANINAALAGMTLAPTANFSGSASLEILTSDLGNTGAGGPLTADNTIDISVSDGAYVSSSGWSTSFDSSRYLDLTFPAYVPAGSVVTGATFRHSYRSTTGGDTTCYYFEVYNGSTLLAAHGSAASPVSCNSSTSYATDVVSLPEVDSVAKADNLRLRLFIKNSGGRKSTHQLATLGVVYSLD